MAQSLESPGPAKPVRKNLFVAPAPRALSAANSQFSTRNSSAPTSGKVPDARLGANLARWDAIPTNQFITTNIGAPQAMFPAVFFLLILDRACKNHQEAPMKTLRIRASSKLAG